MAQSENTPLWLHLKKQYIDDNFDSLQEYLKSFAINSMAKDSFYEQTMALFRDRIAELVDNLSRRPIFNEAPSRDNLLFNAKMLATYLLADPQSSLSALAYTALLGELRLLCPRYSDKLIRTVLKRLEYSQISSIGFSWNDLSKIGTELFVYNACEHLKLEDPVKTPVLFIKNGTAILSSDGIFLTDEDAKNSKALLNTGVNSLDTKIGVTLRSKSGEKFKTQDEKDLSKMDAYVKNFISHLNGIPDKKTVVPLKSYFDSDMVVVRITSIGKDGTIHVVSVDPTYQQIEGTIHFERASLCYYYTDTLYEYFEKGDYLRAVLTNKVKGYFNIEHQLVDFFVKDTQKEAEEENEFLAKLIDEKEGYYGWINAFGIAMFTKNTGEYTKGDFASLAVDRYQKGEYYGKIDAHIIERQEEDFSEKEVRRDCIRAFVNSVTLPKTDVDNGEKPELDPRLLCLVLRQLFEHQKTLLRPSDRFRFLSNANVIAHVVDDQSSSSYITFARSYLLALVKFVNNEDLSDINLIPDSEYANSQPTRLRLSVIDILKEYGRQGNSEKLANVISEFERQDPILAKLARLIQTANFMKDTLSGASLNVIRREIIKTLSLGTEDDSDLEADSNKYVGLESGTQEFKTSMVFPPNNKMQADEYTQNANIMKGICGFLNSQVGGTLYLGVNDQGYVCGVENDMKYLNCSSIDNYLRYVQDTANQTFGKDVLPYLVIKPMYDNRVVAIHIEPHPYRIVEMKGVAYLRINAETREMPEQMKQQLIDQKIFRNKEKAAIVSNLQHAWTQQKCVMLRNYSSSNSGKVSDRFVEAYKVLPEDGLVICLDRDKMVTRVFNINRIGFVEILDKEPWKYKMSHKDVHVDVFHMSGEKPIPISLKLDLFAKNLLIEEYPSAEKFISPNKNDPNEWYFTADVYKIEGVGRFYTGLANHIEILNAPELKEYVAVYVKTYLQ